MHRWMKPALAAAVGLALVAGARVAAAQEKTELEGTWLIRAAKMAGRSAEDAVGDKVVFKGNTMTVVYKDKDRRWEWKFTIDPKPSPKHMDMTLQSKTALAIFEVKEGTLRLNMASQGEPRPEKLESQANSKQFSLVLEREGGK